MQEPSDIFQVILSICSGGVHICNIIINFMETFWTPRCCRKGPLKQGLSILLLFYPPTCLVVFSELCHQCFFFNFGLVLKNHLKLCGIKLDCSGKTFLPPKLGKLTKTMSKTGFFNLLRKFFTNFDWIHFIMKIYIVCCVPAKISYLRKFLFPRYCGDTGQNVFYCRIF